MNNPVTIPASEVRPGMHLWVGWAGPRIIAVTPDPTGVWVDTANGGRCHRGGDVQVVLDHPNIYGDTLA
jgi:hypothetical protein